MFRFGVLVLVMCCCLCSCFPFLRTGEKIGECGVTHSVRGAAVGDAVYVKREKDGKEHFYVKVQMLPYDRSPHWWGTASFGTSQPVTYTRDYERPVETAYVEVSRWMADCLSERCRTSEADERSGTEWLVSSASSFDPKEAKIYGKIGKKGRTLFADPPESYESNVYLERLMTGRTSTYSVNGQASLLVRATQGVAIVCVDVPVTMVLAVTSPVWGGVYYLFNPDCLQ